MPRCAEPRQAQLCLLRLPCHWHYTVVKLQNQGSVQFGDENWFNFLRLLWGYQWKLKQLGKCPGINLRQYCVQSNYSQEWFPVQTSSGCIRKQRTLESRGLCKFWYTLTSARFSAGKISRCQEHSLGMVGFPAFCRAAPAVFREEKRPTFRVCALHLGSKGKEADRNVINQGGRKQDCKEIHMHHLLV